MTDNISWNDVITAIVAVYGAVLSSIIFIKDQQRNKRHVKLKLTNGMLTFDNGGLSEPMLIFEVSNPGHKNVTINVPQLRLDDGKIIILPESNSNVSYPHTLEEGKSAHAWIEYEQLISSLKSRGYRDNVKVKGIINDQTGKEFKTNDWVKLDLN